jgi:hypothetical protein
MKSELFAAILAWSPLPPPGPALALAWPSGSLSWLIIGGVIFCLLLAVIVLVVVGSTTKGKPLYDHRALFESLCRAHQLDRKSRRLLCEVAEFHGLSQPGRLFIERHWLFPMNLSPALKARSADLAALRRRLFHAPKPKPERNP